MDACRPPFSTRLTLLLISSLTVMSGATIAPALPPMAQHFSGIPDAAFWTRLVLTAPAIGIVLTASAAGAVTDRWGRIRPLLFGAVLYAAAGSAGLWVEGIAALVASRVLLGFAVAVLMTGATTLIGDYFHGPSREGFMGLQASFMGYGGVVFLTVGGTLADVHWRAPFVLYLASLGILMMTWRYLWEPNGAGRVRSRRAEAEGRMATTAAPVSPWLLYGLAVLVFATFYQVPTQMPFLLETLGIRDRTLSGLVVASLPLVAATSSLFYRRVKAHLSHGAVMALAFAIVATAYVGVAAGDRLWVVWLATALAGIGLGWTMPNLTVWLMAVVPARRRGRAIGTMTSGVFIGQFLAPIAAQPAVAAFGLSGAFSVAAAALALAAAVMTVLSAQW